MEGVYRLAGRVLAIDSVYPEVHSLCRAYRSEEAPAFWIKTTREDIAAERDISAREGKKADTYPDGYLETLAVYRKMAETLLAENILLVHGSAVAVDGEGYLFTAESGTGKSTHARLWRELFGTRAVMVNDDKPFLELRGETVLVHGTPWDGKHHLSANVSVPLRGVCLLERGEENLLTPLSLGEAYPWLLRQVYRAHDAKALAQTLTLADRLFSAVPLYKLRCNQDISAASVAYEGMKGGGA